MPYSWIKERNTNFFSPGPAGYSWCKWLGHLDIGIKTSITPLSD